MKKISLLVFLAVPLVLLGQIKPSLPKTEKALKEGKLDEAKAIIDATTANQEFMVDKKGQPSKNAAKAWYIKGVVYIAIDTTKKEQFKSLDANPFATAKESFEKAKAIEGDALSFMSDPATGFPMMIESQKVYFAQAYWAKAVAEYSDKKNYKAAFKHAEETLYFIPNDTSILMNAGVYFAPSAEEYTKAIEMIKVYHEKGGKSPDAYLQLLSIYMDKLKDNEKAVEVAKEAVAKFPGNSDFPKFELNLYIKMNKLPEAKAAMQRQEAADPTNKETKYYLGVINMELGDKEESKKKYQEAIALDPKYFDANVALAELIYADARNVKQQMNQLGITPEDKKKRFELDKVYVEKLKIALPYWQTCEKLGPDDGKVLDNLLGIYSDLDMQPDVARITKKMKALGLLD